MVEFKVVHKRLLSEYSRAIVHMRCQVSAQRFGLMFGAGLSKTCGIPNWKELVQKLAQDAEIDGADVLKAIPPRAGLPYQTEMLFEHFRLGKYSKVPAVEHSTRALDYRIGSEWRELVRKHLYAGVSGNLSDLRSAHPYLNQLLPLVRNSYMTVTYNFDDLLEQCLLQEAAARRSGSRGFESVTNPWMQFRSGTAAIYHPSGVVPQNPMETPSDRFIFSEASYAKQLMAIFAGDQAGMVSHLSKHTCLLIGLSLEDDTLRNLLTQAAHASPGNYHYYVHYLTAGEKLSDATRNAITYANFKVYNLITLFLEDEGIGALGDLLDLVECNQEDFCDFAGQHGIPTRFRFYITGAIGVGKSSAVNNFRNLLALDEWLEQRPPLLAKGWGKLTEEERKEADAWIASQFDRKNAVLRNGKEGIFMLDRGPADPVAFTPDAEWNGKAQLLLAKLCPNQCTWRIEDGRVILLQADSDELALRALTTQRNDYDSDSLRDMEERLVKVYGSVGVTKIDTRGLTPADVARRIGEIVHLEAYTERCDLHARLERLREKGCDVNEND